MTLMTLNDIYRYVLLIGLLIAVGMLHAQSNDPFERGVKAYQDENYTAAISAFEDVISTGQRSADLYYNLGNAHLQLQEIGKAILNFEKALLISPNDKNVIANLTIAKESILNPLSHIPDFILVEWWRAVSKSVGVSVWILLQIISLLILLIMAVAKWTRFLPGVKDKLLGWKGAVALLVPALLSVVFLLAAMSKSEMLNHPDQVIIMQEDTSLNDGPDERSNEVTTLSEGVKGKIIDHIDDWYKLQMEDKDEGWVKMDRVEVIGI